MVFYQRANKAVPGTSREGDWGEKRHNSYLFLISALDGVSGQRHAPVTLYPQENGPGTHWIGGCAREPVWTQRLEEKSFVPAKGRTLVVQSVVRHYTDWATPNNT
jgi:hypothetical protein